MIRLATASASWDIPGGDSYPCYSVVKPLASPHDDAKQGPLVIVRLPGAIATVR